MADMKVMQPSFTAGEVSNQVAVRVDLAKFRQALKTAKNVYIHPQGGLSNRPGLIFTGEVADSERAARLIPFQRSVDIRYALEFGHETMRVYRDGDAVLSDDERSISSVDLTPEHRYRFVLDSAHGWDVGDEIYFYGFTVTGVMSGRHGRIISTGSGSQVVVEDLHGVGIGSLTTLPDITGGKVASIYQLVTPYASTDVKDLVYVQEADVMFITHEDHPPQKLSRLGDNEWTIESFDPRPEIDAPSPAPTVDVGTVDTSNPYQDTDYQYKVSAIGEDGEESLPSAATAVAVNDLDAHDTNKNTINWTAVAGAERYIVYKLDNGVYGYIGGTTALTFVDNNITPDLSDTPQKPRNPFNTTGNYPRCCAFHEGRLVFASTINNPGLVEMSQSANYENFSRSSPAKASDSISFRIRSKQLNDIHSLVSGRGLMIFTAGAEWSVSGGQQDFISPSQIVTKRETSRGSSKLQPLEVGSTILFPQRVGSVVRDFRYDFAQDNFSGDDLTVLSRHLFEELTIKAWAYAQSPHSIVWVVMSDGSLLSLTYLREHEVWGWTRHETADGAFEDVIVLTETDEDVPYFIVRRTIKGLEKRYIERLHTRSFDFIRQAFFVDSGLTYSGADATSISGLWHLEGETLAGLAGGDVVKDLVVTDGEVTLPDAAALVHLGKSYEAEIETLPLDLGVMRGTGSSQGRMMNIAAMLLEVENTRGLWVGPPGKLEDQEVRSTQTYDEAIKARTEARTIRIGGKWSAKPSVVIRQVDPLPMTVLAVVPDVAVGG